MGIPEVCVLNALPSWSLGRRPLACPGYATLSGLYLILMGLVGIGAEAAFLIGFVVLKIALEPDHLAIALEGEHVGGDAIEEPAIMADDHGAAGEIEERVFKGAKRIHVKVIGRLVEEEDVGALLQRAWPDAHDCARHPRAGRLSFADPGL